MSINQHDRDLYCLKQAGYIVLKDFVDIALVDKIEKACVGFELEVEAFRSEQEVILSHSWPLRTTRCLYAVSQELQDLVMRERIQKLVHGYLDKPVLRDSLMQTNMPDPRNAERGLDGDISFHRDTLWPDGEITPNYLHVFLLLNDFTPEHGATIVVPGTHREKEPGYYFKNSDPRPPQKGIDYRVYEQSYFPSTTQLLAPRGSVILMDPMMIHSQGINIADTPRRVINTTFRAAQTVGKPPLLNARAIAEHTARVPIRQDLLSLLEDTESLPSEYGPLRELVTEA
ncbi:phytanoyl-CoA dioxygenase family protein [Thalassomonas sp. RHCl1]|uniref:phytanoyl-CoA dioxygenase family protein n=1 Tax=Thalassomonas sp. RHCl1 TaxID=2995320 RepID=UPI00248BE2C0|nr:phytanoyl-CoA dioxygenase family protein [Thalassomonas sp. RHCl1]